MPISQYPDRSFLKPYHSVEPPEFDLHERRCSEDSTRTEDFGEPIPEMLMESSPTQDVEQDQRNGQGETLCSDRAELIERIKRGESPTWVPNEALKQEYLKNNPDTIQPHGGCSRDKEPSSLLPAAELKAIAQLLPDSLQERSNQQRDIQRPRSAPHAGDFAADSTDRDRIAQETFHSSKYPPSGFEDGSLGFSPNTSWCTPPSAVREYGQIVRSNLYETSPSNLDSGPRRYRAPSLNSYSSSSYILKAPTTPLVQQSNNTDLDFSPREGSMSPGKSNRRRTLPPHAFHNIQPGAQSVYVYQAGRQSLSSRRESSSSNGHHLRRSLTFNWSLQASTSPQTPPYLRSRRTSLSSDASPLQHAHMVGSYEESILRGWMSTAPSKPLDFTAKIGVLGRGKCKPKCPAHVTIPFPAVFYSWSPGNGRRVVSDDPSPYVGHIELQNSNLSTEQTKSTVSEKETSIDRELELRGSDRDIPASKFSFRKSKKRRRDSPSSAPPGGSYRIPQQGQLQVVIKNPNKTAVKLFLVQYDLEGMEPGTKTFVRQKSYSADRVNDSQNNSASFSGPATATKKPTLRYLIDLKICSPSQGRFYLYQQIRVVFANRVPDDKEPLQNEIQLPHPKYSPYRPARDSLSGPSSNAGVGLSAGKSHRRRSSGFGMGSDEVDDRTAHVFAGGSMMSQNSGPTPPVPAIPFNLAVQRREAIREVRGDDFNTMELDASRPTTSDDTQSPTSEKGNRLLGAQLSSSYRSSSSQGSDGYKKLTKGDSGYGGLFGRPGTPEPGEGLLARRLKGFGIQRDA